VLPSLKVSTQALMLQIAAEQLWGPGNHAKLDHIIVALPHPEAAAAVFNPGHEINTHFAAVTRAFEDSFEWINADKRRAAKLYVAMTKEKKLTEDELTASFSGKDMEYTKVPSQVGKLVDFLYRTGSVKTKALSWKDLFFPEAHALPGS